ncbi:MAG: hypothetical protein ABSG53_19495 [Thermoguttaceae bacterium]
MYFPMILILAAVTAQGNDQQKSDQFNWGGHSAVVFQCDFSHYPPKSNVEFTVSGCDYAIFFDQHPHLRLTTPEQSRFTMKFRLPEVPKAAFLQAEHLASADNQGKCVAPVSIVINGSPLVEEWNVAQATYCQTRWSLGDKLRKGENTIEWRAGKLRSHYWLRKAEVEVAFAGPVEVQFPVPRIEHALFWEGRFSQCSYNALATVLDHFYGVEGWSNERDAFEKRLFVSALDKFGLGGYFGWAPWTSYMAQAGTIRWNGHLVSDLKAERFSLTTKAIPTPKGMEMIVQYESGEKARLVKQLRSRLEKGPVIIWTPYAAAMRGGEPWQHVRSVDPATDSVRFSPHMTHSVVVNLEGGNVKVYDNSWPGGVWAVEPGTIVATAAAMVGSVEGARKAGRNWFEKSFGGVKDNEYNVVFWKE